MFVPKYSKSNIRYTIREDDFERIIKRTPRPRDKLFLALLYCTGARPSEIMGDPFRGLKGMTYGNIIIDKENSVLHFYVPVSKLKGAGFAITRRHLVLEYNAENPSLAIQIIIRAIQVEELNAKRQGKEFGLDKPLFLNQANKPMCRMTGYNIVNRASRIIGVDICPYNFRHSRLTILAEQGAGIETLMYFKGSKRIKSIEPYIHAREVKFSLTKRLENVQSRKQDISKQ